MRKAAGIVVSIAICELAGVVGALFTSPAIPGWYGGLVKPSFNPPNGVFGPVWTALYALMGLAAWLVFAKGAKRPDVKKALVVFAAQLVLNTLWSIVFFGAHLILAAGVVILLLWAAILGTILLFRKISPAAAYLLLPYILWVSFAAALNASIYLLNR
ncbi:MAG TPA: TspO/MBR family protein [Acidobacteriota bacterium]|nr:TspO/MBR family protein [Acidobacteriota bacterium]